MARDNYLNLPEFCARMKEAGMAAVVAASPNAVFHTSGCLIITHNPIRDRLAFCITTAEGHQCLVVCTIEVSLCEHDSWVKDIRGYVEFKQLPTELLAETLADLGLTGKVVGMELDYLREWYFRELTAAAPNVKFVPADDLLQRSRDIKPVGQVAQMRKAAAGVEAAIAQTLKDPLAGLTERQVRARLRSNLADSGADGSYLVVAAGANIAVPEHRASDHVIADGEPLLLDAAVTFDGYVAEAAASSIIGATAPTPTEAGLDAVYQAAAGALAAGARARDVYAKAEAGARDTGGKLVGDWVGYSVSFGGRDAPFLAPSSRDVLAAGMTIALDVGYEDPSGILLRRKRLWLIDDNKAVELSHSA